MDGVVRISLMATDSKESIMKDCLTVLECIFGKMVRYFRVSLLMDIDRGDAFFTTIRDIVLKVVSFDSRQMDSAR